ncbi:MAG: hypothetical protein ACRD1K_04055 [Acidimicrobiales bacterium]
MFLSDPDLKVTLTPPGRHQVFGRDGADGDALPPARAAIDGIVEALTRLDHDADRRSHRRIDRTTGHRPRQEPGGGDGRVRPPGCRT